MSSPASLLNPQHRGSVSDIDNSLSLALTIDEIRWLQATEAILESPVEELRNGKLDKAQASSDPGANIYSTPTPAEACTRPPVWLLTPTLPTPSSTPAAEFSEGTSDTPSSSFIEESLSSSTKSASPAQARGQSPSLHRNRTWNRNRHYHVGGSSMKDDPSSPVSSSSSPIAAFLPTPIPSSPVHSSSSIPIPVSPASRSPVTPIRPSLSRSLPSQRTEWIYRQPKPRSPPSLSVSTSSSSTSTSKATSPITPSRIPLRPRTRSTSSRMKQRPRPQTGLHPRITNISATLPKKPVHTTLPARPSLAPKPTLPPTDHEGFWSTLLSRSKSNPGKRSSSGSVTTGTAGSSSFEFLDIAKEKFGTASSSLSSLLSLELSQPPSQNEDDKERKEGKEKTAKPSLIRPPTRRNKSLSSALASSTRIAQAANVAPPIGKVANLVPPTAPKIPPSFSTASTPRTRSSSSSSNSSSSTSRSVSTAATSTSTISFSPSISTAPTAPLSSHGHPGVAQAQLSPSKSILSRTSSTTSSSRPVHNSSPLAVLFGGGGTPSSAKSVTFVDVPTVHYATSYPHSDGESESDTGGGAMGGGASDLSIHKPTFQDVEADRNNEEGAGKAGIGAHGRRQSQAMGNMWPGHVQKRGHGVHHGNWHDQGVDVDGMDLGHVIEEEDEDDEAMHTYPGNAHLHEQLRASTPKVHLRGQQRRQRSDTTPSKKTEKTDSEEGAVGLKRLMSLTRKSADSSPKPRTKREARPSISGPFALGSLPLASSSTPSPPPSPFSPPPPASPYSRSTPGRSSSSSSTTSSTTSLRSHLSYSSSIKHTTPSRSTSVRAAHYKSHSYSGRTQFPLPPTTPSSATTSPYKTTRSHCYYPTSLRAAPSLESFKSTTGRSVRSLGSVKSTASTRGFRAWLAKFGEGIGIGGGTGDKDD